MIMLTFYDTIYPNNSATAAIRARGGLTKRAGLMPLPPNDPEIVALNKPTIMKTSGLVMPIFYDVLFEKTAEKRLRGMQKRAQPADDEQRYRGTSRTGDIATGLGVAGAGLLADKELSNRLRTRALTGYVEEDHLFDRAPKSKLREFADTLSGTVGLDRNRKHPHLDRQLKRRWAGRSALHHAGIVGASGLTALGLGAARRAFNRES